MIADPRQTAAASVAQHIEIDGNRIAHRFIGTGNPIVLASRMRAGPINNPKTEESVDAQEVKCQNTCEPSLGKGATGSEGITNRSPGRKKI